MGAIEAHVRVYHPERGEQCRVALRRLRVARIGATKRAGQVALTDHASGSAYCLALDERALGEPIGGSAEKAHELGAREDRGLNRASDRAQDLERCAPRS